LFGSRKFFIRQNSRLVELGELLKLGYQIGARRRRRRLGWRRIGLLLGLCIGCTLLLRSCILLCIFLLLTMADRTCGTNDRRRRGDCSNNSSSSHSSSNHFDLLIYF
jgi:hypothetical protein